MTETTVIFESDKQLQTFLGMGLYIPNLLIWVKIPLVDFNSKRPIELGDEITDVPAQYYGIEIDEFAYVVLRENTMSRIDGSPTGNYKAVSKKIQQSWIAKYGVDNMFLNAPVIADEQMEE